MIQKVTLSPVNVKNQAVKSNGITMPAKSQNVSFEGLKTQASKLASAYQALNGIKTAKTVNFAGGISLNEVFDKFNMEVVTCDDPAAGIKGEMVGSRANVSEIIEELHDSLPKYEDAVKTNIVVSKEDRKEQYEEQFSSTGRYHKYEKTVPYETIARTQVKNAGEDFLYEMAVRQPKSARKMRADISLPLKQNIRVLLTPDSKMPEPMKELVYVLNTKGNLMSVVEDNSSSNPIDRFILMTDTGKISKKDTLEGTLVVNARKDDNVFVPFEAPAQVVRERHPEPSIGKGTEIVIGMENGRFVPEIIQSIVEFEEKINSGKIVLDTFVAAPDADKTQIAMLAGGFGSRAEYTNASSDGIFHGKDKGKLEHGAQSTKGVFRTSTGLTPMETTFITLHNAGLLDCSKGVFGVGKNVKFYLNKSGVNKGNGGFTIDMYNKMKRAGRENLLILPNDPISRVTNAMVKAKELIDSGEAAMVMIAKEVDPSLAKDFGIMKLGANNEILQFVEKPKNPSKDLISQEGKCMANTFQFAVSKEAFKALEILSPYFPAGKGKEPRDWSKCLTPILMSLTQNDDLFVIRKEIASLVNANEGSIPMDKIMFAKKFLGDQKILAVPTDEPWADCGSLNQLYHTTMQIASGDFKLEDFERANVLKCVNTKTGLVATSSELKDKVESKYDIKGQVMATERAEKVDPSIVDYFADAITINEKSA